MNIESSEFEHGRVYFKQFGAERVKGLTMKGLTMKYAKSAKIKP